MVGGPACGRRLGLEKARDLEIEFVDERIDHPHRIILRDIVVQALRQE
jgi:hypothetical protein